ncbi:hypothetical protein VCUG_00601 [Vavraia culicis subsp. floridensis]|uniref:Kinetochore protein NDC80 n=1 Tax=Vavraia culicis (isolate floridensis) TaxID=948595 RepID=L2GW54_VAVCU|nr:uncharacterized protein VCUG_00601 [Vavraia culicis subsp. floridensis]ELA47881.1 hypothetical protein VCUG_00601 [Vavraia culicis subsp. floridensis]
MRRNTLTPARGRLSLAYPSSPVPEKRNVRSSSYQEQCITNVQSFLEEHNYENTSHKSVRNPTLKEFQNLFKFVISFFYKNWECKRFEDDAMLLIKQIKYPYVNEINKSHLVTTSPHSWPVVLSFISWMVDMVRFVGVCEAEETDMFLECCFDGYLRFMEGVDNHFEDRLSEQFRKKHEMKIREYEDRMDRKRDLDDKLGEWEMNGENAALKRKIEELEDDRKSIMDGFKQLEVKKEKYQKITEKYAEEIKDLNDGMDALQSERNKLKECIGKQRINVDSYKEMNGRKNELLKQLERIKPEKEKCFVMLSEKEKELSVLREEMEKYVHDFKCVSGLSASHDVNDTLEDAINVLNERIVVLEEKKLSLEEKRNELANHASYLEENIKHLNGRLLSIGKLYLEKKEMSDLDEHRGRKEMDKLDNELMNLTIESNNSILLSEQALQRAKIQMDRIVGEIRNEQDEVSKEIVKFYGMMSNDLENAVAVAKEIGEL